MGPLAGELATEVSGRSFTICFVYLCGLSNRPYKYLRIKQTTDANLLRREGCKKIVRWSFIPSLDPLFDSFREFAFLTATCLLYAIRFFYVDEKQDIFNDL